MDSVNEVNVFEAIELLFNNSNIIFNDNYSPLTSNNQNLLPYNLYYIPAKIKNRTAYTVSNFHIEEFAEKYIRIYNKKQKNLNEEDYSKIGKLGLLFLWIQVKIDGNFPNEIAIAAKLLASFPAWDPKLLFYEKNYIDLNNINVIPKFIKAQNIYISPLYFYRLAIQSATDIKSDDLSDIQLLKFNKLIIYCNVEAEDYITQLILFYIKKCFDNNLIPCIIVFRYWEILIRLNKNIATDDNLQNNIENNLIYDHSQLDNIEIDINAAYSINNYNTSELSNINNDPIINENQYINIANHFLDDNIDHELDNRIALPKKSNIYIYQENEDNDFKTIENAIGFSTKYYYVVESYLLSLNSRVDSRIYELFNYQEIILLTKYYGEHCAHNKAKIKLRNLISSKAPLEEDHFMLLLSDTLISKSKPTSFSKAISKLDLESNIINMANYLLNLSPDKYKEFLNIISLLKVDFENNEIMILIIQAFLLLNGNPESVIKFYNFFERITRLKFPKYN